MKVSCLLRESGFSPHPRVKVPAKCAQIGAFLVGGARQGSAVHKGISPLYCLFDTSQRTLIDYAMERQLLSDAWCGLSTGAKSGEKGQSVQKSFQQLALIDYEIGSHLWIVSDAIG